LVGQIVTQNIHKTHADVIITDLVNERSISPVSSDVNVSQEAAREKTLLSNNDEKNRIFLTVCCWKDFHFNIIVIFFRQDQICQTDSYLVYPYEHLFPCALPSWFDNIKVIKRPK